MGAVHRFKRPPRKWRQFKSRKPKLSWTSKRRRRWGYSQIMLATLGVSIGALGGMTYLRSGTPNADDTVFSCPSPQVIDGDTIRCGDRRVRLYGIDSPELPGHCRPGRNCAPGDPYASTANLEALISGATLECRQKDIDVYGRTVARCSAGETDLSCAQIKDGQAIRRYGMIFC